MRSKWKNIWLLLMGSIVIVLYVFGNERNKTREVANIEVRFTGDEPPFIAYSAVNKLLIQNEDSLSGLLKEKVVLNEMEGRLEDHAMVRKAEVFLTINGEIGAKIEQRDPVARIVGSPDYYLDADGLKMPLSDVYAARVPLVTGISERQHQLILPLVLELADDPLMHQLVTGMKMTEGDEVTLFLRTHSLSVSFGEPNDLDEKIRNFKAFYQKAKRDGTLEQYHKVDLRFGNQVVATKR